MARVPWKLNMKISNISFSHFCDAFRDTGREDQFTYKGKRALYDYLEELGNDTGEEIGLDVIALCCEYAEYDSAMDAWREYTKSENCTTGEIEPCGCQDCEDFTTEQYDEYEDEREKSALEWLQDRTQVIPVDGGGVIIAQF